MNRLKKSLLSLTLCALFGASPVFAQNINTSGDQLQLAKDLDRQAQTALKAKRYLEAAELFSKASKLAPQFKVKDLAYDGACAYALAGANDLAFTWLNQAIQAGFYDLAHVKKDTDLLALHADQRWQPMLENMQARAKFEARLWDSEVWDSRYQVNLSEDEKVAGLSRFWSEVKYNFVYTKTLRELDWDAQYLKYLPKVRATKTTLEYYRVLQEMCALLKDGHTNVYVPDVLYQTELVRPGFRSSMIEGRVFITRVDDEKLRKLGLVSGLEILNVNGQKVQDYVQKNIAPYASSSTPQDLEVRSYSYEFLMGSLSEKIKLTLSDAKGKTWEVEVERPVPGKPPKNVSRMSAFSWSMLPNNVAYVALNSFGDDTAAEEYLTAFSDIAKATAIIFDIRNNGGGSGDVGFRILQTITNKPFATSAAATRQYRPTSRAHGDPEEMYRYKVNPEPADLDHQFNGKVVVLTSAKTFSAAEDFAVAFDTMQRGKIIGEPTGGSTGQPLLFSLPGGGSARVCTKQDTYPDGKAFVGVGVQPHQLVRPTIADFRANRDTVLEAALLSLQK